MDDAAPVLILGGTSEANALAAALATRGRPVVLSLAGRTRAPVTPPGCTVRSGGFGGIDGLAAYCAAHGIARLVDATHPFAVRMAANACGAAGRTGVPTIKLLRPAWAPRAGDDWRMVATEAQAAAMMESGARPFLALGRQHVASFLTREDIRPVLRMIEPPDAPLPTRATLIRARPEADAAAEAALLARHAITHLVCRNAGGAASYAKVEAARALSLPIVMIERPGWPATACVATVTEALDWLERPDGD